MSLDALNDHLILLDTYVQDYWTKRDRRLSRILRVMDNVEYWVLEDEEDFAQGINRLGRHMSMAEPEQLEKVSDQLVIVLAYMSSSKAIRLINWLEEHHPDVFQRLVHRLPSHERSKAAKLLSTRLRVLQSLDLISKVFNPQRSHRIQSWLRTQISQGATE